MKNLPHLLILWMSLVSPTNIYAQGKGAKTISKPNSCIEDCKDAQKCECDIFNQNYLDNQTHYIHFNQNGQLIGKMPSIVRKGDMIFFVIEGENLTTSPLQDKIKKYQKDVQNIKFDSLSIESRLIFPDSNAFNNYNKDIQTFLPKIDTITINSIYQLTINWYDKDDCSKSQTLSFDIMKAPCDLMAISTMFYAPCELPSDKIGFLLTRQNIDNLLIANYLHNNSKLYSDWSSYEKNFRSIKDSFNKLSKTVSDSLNQYDYKRLMYNDSVPSQYLIDTLEKVAKKSDTITRFFENIVLDSTAKSQNNREWMKKWLWFTGLQTPIMNPFDKIKPNSQKLGTIDNESALTQKRIDAINAIVKNSQLADTNEMTIKKYLSQLDSLNQLLVILNGEKNTLSKQIEDYQKWLNSIQIESNLLYAGILFVSDHKQINWMPHYNADDNYRLSNEPNSVPEVVADIDGVRPIAFNLKRGTKAYSEETITPFTLTTPITDAFNVWGKVFDGILDVGKSLAVRGVEPILNLLTKKQRLQNQIEALNHTLPGFNSVELASPFEMQSFKSNTYQLEDKNKTRKKLSKSKILLDLKDRKENTYSMIEGFEMPDSEKNKTINWAKKFYELRDSLLPILENRKKNIENKLTYEQARNNFETTTNRLKWLNTQTAPLLKIDLKANSDTLYHTDWVEAKEIKEKKGAVVIGYDLYSNDGKTSTKVIKNVSYKQYDLPRFWYGVGVAYIPQPRYTSVYDETNGVFVNNAEPQQLDVVVGAKIYFKHRMNQMRTCKLAKYTHYGKCYDQLRGNGHLNRLSTFVGIGVRYKFLRNYFVGLGYDIMPGLNVNVGINTYFKRTYEIENGKLINSYERLTKPTLYYSITTDIQVFTRLVQLINPF